MLDISRFLAASPPFSSLPADDLADIAGSVQVEYFPAGARVLAGGGQAAGWLYVIRTGAMLVFDGADLVDRLEPGDYFGHDSVIDDSPPEFTVMAAEDAICYLIDGSRAARALGASEIAPRRHEPVPPGQGRAIRASIRVGDLVDRRLVVVTESTTIRHTADLLTENGVTAAVVEMADGTGIVTDRDIRARAVAGRVDPDSPVGTISTAPVVTVRPDDPAEEALLTMLDLGVHHLPVVGADGEARAILTDLDLLDLNRRDAVRLRSRLERAATVDEAAGTGAEIPTALVPLVRSGVDGEHVGRIVASLYDALTVRLLELAFARLGRPTAQWAWLALGSMGRREAALLTDQDHALVYADDGVPEAGLFAEAAAVVTDGLERAGLARCPSRVMAGEEGWIGSEAWWRARFADWMGERDRAATFLTGIAFDARRVAGDLDFAAVIDPAVEAASRSQPFLRRVGSLALEIHIPVGFLGNLVVGEVGDRQGVLDIKAGGLLPITEMARLHGLRAGLSTRQTVGRLLGASEAGHLDAPTAAGLVDAFRFMHDLRLRHQADQLADGGTPDNLIAPAELGNIERGSLREAFRLVRHARRRLGEELAPRLLGR